MSDPIMVDITKPCDGYCSGPDVLVTRDAFGVPVCGHCKRRLCPGNPWDKYVGPAETCNGWHGGTYRVTRYGDGLRCEVCRKRYEPGPPQPCPPYIAVIGNQPGPDAPAPGFGVQFTVGAGDACGIPLRPPTPEPVRRLVEWADSAESALQDEFGSIGDPRPTVGEKAIAAVRAFYGEKSQ